MNTYMSLNDLANRIVGLAPSFLLSCFISGLSPKIQREVLQEDKLDDRRRSYKAKHHSLALPPLSYPNNTSSPRPTKGSVLQVEPRGMRSPQSEGSLF